MSFSLLKNFLYYKQKQKGIFPMKNAGKKLTVVGTDIEEVKRLNSQSGLSYNQVKQLLAEKNANKK